jgi:hypothetical protein
LKDSNANPKMNIVEEEGIGEHFVIRNISGVKRAC